MKRMIALVAFVCFACTGFAQKHENSLLWKIEGNGLQKPSYLFGTVHMICAENFMMPEKVAKAMEKTTQSYLEIDLDSPDFAVESAKHLKSNKTISEQVTPEQAKFIDSMLQAKIGISLKIVDSIKPMAIMSMMMQKDFKCPLVSFEQEVIKRTTQKNQQTHGLSSVEEQFSFMDKIVPAKDFAAVVGELNKFNIEDLLKDMYRSYKSEDVTSINKMMEGFNTTNPDAYHYLLTVRNNLWVNRLPQIMKEQATFIAVGSAHLSGHTGMIQLLQDRGYKVTPVLN
jgi:uncharacterized protein YbaP (TraB family)